ncbi:AmmeMemoRadiSam system protein A [Veronia pacifica]|uniref:AmmeMemoRadiSam system protein A n=1 Tax=Veronia pacifica TaxID=1080227 RepID=A0A1C3EBS7_9GAMM|nr:AmmeMemoRadiSam system protein A [Veronia pacifica]ODA30689.1 AmmeMemoRadiSam system protein A [Veronia pacifica]
MSVTLSAQYDRQDLSQLIEISRSVLTQHFNNDPLSLPEPAIYSEKLLKPAGCFVTLEVDHHLQGCIGAISSVLPLIHEVHNKTLSAAFQDRRFQPLVYEQLAKLSIEVSVLSSPEKLEVHSEQGCLDFLEENKVGVILSCQRYRSVFLPQVWEKLPIPFDFIVALKKKGGMDEHDWPDDMRVDVFTVDSAQEDFQ